MATAEPFPPRAPPDQDMTEVERVGAIQDFVESGRTGRRNAMGDILDEKATGSGTGNVTVDMANLSCSDGASTSQSANPAPSQTQTSSSSVATNSPPKQPT